MIESIKYASSKAKSPFQHPAYEESPYSYRKDVIYTPDYQPTTFISITTLLTFF
jgi:hypothetical protein